MQFRTQLQFEAANDRRGEYDVADGTEAEEEDFS